MGGILNGPRLQGYSGFNGQIDHPGRRNEVTRTRVGLFAAIHIHLNGTDGSEPPKSL